MQLSYGLTPGDLVLDPASAAELEMGSLDLHELLAWLLREPFDTANRVFLHSIALLQAIAPDWAHRDPWNNIDVWMACLHTAIIWEVG